MLRRILTICLLGLFAAGWTASAHANIVLFQDTFDRPNNSDLNADLPSGQSGTLVPSGGIDWLKFNNNDSSITNNALRMQSGGAQPMIVSPDFNFNTEGSFTFSLDVNGHGTSVGDLFMITFRDTQSGIWLGESNTSWGLGFRWDNGRVIVTANGSNVYDQTGVLPIADLRSDGWFNIEITVASAAVAANESASVVVKIDGVEYDFGLGNEFEWIGSDNYIRVAQQRATANGVSIDNFTVSIIPEPASLVLMGLGGLMLIARRR